MGFKLQDRIQRTKGLPGKYKRLLLAMASHAYKDGTNVWAAKTTLAEEMGTDRRTVNRNMDGLLMTGLVREAETHRCSNDFCQKGSKHYTERGNHWTQAYNIDLVAVQNVTPLPKKVVRHFVQESHDILSNSRVTKCPAKQGYENPAPLGIKEEASVLTNGSKQVSKPASEEMAGAQTFHTENKPTPEPFTDEEYKLLNEILPIRNQDIGYKQDIVFILGFASKLGVNAIDVLRYNRSVKKGGLYIRTPKAFVTALMGDEEGKFTLINEYVVWRDKIKDKPKAKAAHASGTGFGAYICSGCGREKEDCTCKVTAEEIEAIEGDEPVAVGRGFSVEEAE